ncbi:MAG: hypothetical protein J6X25_03940 [Bacteroidales bacterium]|nr:hypothetical protein [Bacteroidales bacterium]
MRVKFCLAALLLFSAIGLYAQKDNNRYWDSGPLTWGDYTQSSAITEDGSGSSNSFGWETKDAHEEYGNLTVHRVVSRVYLNKAQSWVNPTLATDRQLRYNQLFFDLNELYCRRMLREIYDPDTNFDVGFVQDYYIGLVAVKMTEINTMSDHGTDEATVAYFDTVVQSQLEALPRSEFKPANLKKGTHGFGIRGGLTGEFFMGKPAESLGTVYMMDFGLRYYYNRFFVDAGFGIGALKARDDISTPRINLYKGQILSDIQANGFVGFNLYDGSWVRIAPMAGIGYNGVSLLDTDEEDEITPMALSGLRIMAGLDLDLKATREAYIFPDDRSLAENCLNFRVYLAKTGFNAGMDGLTLNVGISYSLQYFGLKGW